MKHLETHGFKLYGKLYRRYYSAKEAATQLGVNDSRIRQLIGEDRFPGTIKNDQGHNMIPASAVLAFEQQERPAHRPKSR